MVQRGGRSTVKEDGWWYTIQDRETVGIASGLGGRDDKKFNFTQGEQFAGYKSGFPADIWK